MFQTLESTWDKSARRGWSTVASFTMQALALSMLLAVPVVWLEGPPPVRWIDSSIFSPPPGSPSPQPEHARVQRAANTSEVSGIHILQPAAIPDHVTQVNDMDAPPAPSLGDLGVVGSPGTRAGGVYRSIGEPTVSVAPPPAAPVASHPLIVSHWAEGNIVRQVQPKYPPLAQAAGIQGTVQLRAIVSKSGTIEDLKVVSGPAMLITAAVEAVKQWRYRPYMLNGEPIEVDTEITVRFVMAQR
jgi:protein TonB